jgi:hypothetical protein
MICGQAFLPLPAGRLPHYEQEALVQGRRHNPIVCPMLLDSSEELLQ